MNIEATITLLRNLNISRKHCNEARFAVVAAGATLVTARKLRRTSNGQNYIHLSINNAVISWRSSVYSGKTTIPVRPALAMTVNKSQGQAFKKCGSILPTSLSIRTDNCALQQAELDTAATSSSAYTAQLQLNLIATQEMRCTERLCKYPKKCYHCCVS